MRGNQLLKDKDAGVGDDVLKTSLGDIYPAFEKMMTIACSEEFGLTPQWNWYNDGKAWLCKMCYKKKTIFWVSVWDNCFAAGFYFADRLSQEVAALPISREIIDSFLSAKTFGKLRPMTFEVDNESQLADLFKVADYKKSVK